MKIYESSIGNGIKELAGIGNRFHSDDYDEGYDEYYDREVPVNKQIKEVSDDLAKMLKKQKSVVVASLTAQQKREARVLRQNGFKQIMGTVENPNSGNMIRLYAWEPKKVTKPKTSKKHYLTLGGTNISCGIEAVVGIDNTLSCGKLHDLFADEYEEYDRGGMLLAAPDPKHKKAILSLQHHGFKKARAIKGTTLYVKQYKDHE